MHSQSEISNLIAQRDCDNEVPLGDYACGPFCENRAYRRAHGSKKKVHEPRLKKTSDDIYQELLLITRAVEEAPEIDRADLSERLRQIQNKIIWKK